MTTDGGGWTLVMNINSAFATQYDAGDVLETLTTFGGPDDENYLSPAFYHLDFNESYVIDEIHNAPESSIPLAESVNLATRIAELADNPEDDVAKIWAIGTAATRLRLIDSATNDGVFSENELRLEFTIHYDATDSLEHPVTAQWMSTGNHTLIMDSAQGYAGARVAGGLANISSVGVDNRYQVFVRSESP